MLGSRYTHLSFAWTLAAFLSCALAQDTSRTFDCKESIIVGNLAYDLRDLDVEKSVWRDRDSPPSKFRDTVRFNVCTDLTAEDDVPLEDRCPSQTRACLTKTNMKGSNRITAVIPLANSTLDAITYGSLTAPKGLQITYKGPSYPSSTSSEPVSQSFNLKVLCDTNDMDPTFTSYDGQVMQVEWHHTAGCGFSGAPPGAPGAPEDKAPSGGVEEGDSERTRTVGSGVGLFFLLLLVAFVGYFALGAYYNYSTYGASGIDLIPHRDFWREVPYMLQDVVSHLCSTVRPRQTSSRGGYIAV